MDIGSLTVTVDVKGLWRVRAACWIADKSLSLVNWAVNSLHMRIR